MTTIRNTDRAPIWPSMLKEGDVIRRGGPRGIDLYVLTSGTRDDHTPFALCRELREEDGGSK